MNTDERIAELTAELKALRASRPRPKAKRIETFKPGEVALIAKQADDTTAEGLRFRLLCALLLASGLRIGEAVRLSLTDLERKRGGVIVIHVPDGPGCKTGYRAVPIAEASLAPYLKRWLKGGQTGPWLLSTYRGTHIDPNSFARALKLYAERAGVGRQVHPHMFRHTFASEWLASGRDLASLQAMLGHKSPKQSLDYAHADTTRLEEIARGA